MANNQFPIEQYLQSIIYKNQEPLRILQQAGDLTQQMQALKLAKQKQQGEVFQKMITAGYEPYENGTPASANSVMALAMGNGTLSGMTFKRKNDVLAYMWDEKKQAAVPVKNEQGGWVNKDQLWGGGPKSSANQTLYTGSMKVNPDGTVTTTISDITGKKVTDPMLLSKIDKSQIQWANSAANKEETQQDKLEKDYRDMLNKGLSNRSGGLGLQDAKVNQAIHLRQMLDQYYDQTSGEYKVPSSQYEELAIGLANLVSGSNQATESMIHGIKQRTAKGDINGAISYIMGTTPSASTKDIFNNLADSIDRQGMVSERLRNKYLDQLRAKKPTSLSNERASQLNGIELGTNYSDILRESPAKKSTKVGGKLMVDQNGNKAIVYPDGSFEEVK